MNLDVWFCSVPGCQNPSTHCYERNSIDMWFGFCKICYAIRLESGYFEFFHAEPMTMDEYRVILLLDE